MQTGPVNEGIPAAPLRHPRRGEWHLRRFAQALFVTAVGASILFALPHAEEVLAYLQRARLLALIWLSSTPPTLYFAAFTLLPALGFPLTLFYLTVGGMTGSLSYSLLIAAGAIASNIALSHYLASAVFRQTIERALQLRGIAIPQARSHPWKVVFAIRASPLPWLLQNNLIPLTGIPFHCNLIVSLPIQWCIGTCIIVVGDSLLEGRFAWALSALALLFILSLVFHYIRQRKPQPERLDPSTPRPH